MIPRRPSIATWFWTSFLLSSAVFLALFGRQGLRFHLPHQWQFANDTALNAWQPFGGAWRVADGEVFNDSEERGAKLLGGASWSNYQLDADLQLRGSSGDGGLVIRSSAEEYGVDSYRGYNVGLHGSDNTLYIGRADYSWQEAEASRLPQPLLPEQWYHLHVVAVGCQIAGELTDLQAHPLGAVLLQDPPGACFSSGRIGLRSVFTSAAWRQLRVAAATEADLDRVVALRRKENLVEPPRSLGELLSYYRHLLAGSAPPAQPVIPKSTPQAVRDLDLPSPAVASTVLVRGEVTLLRPVLFVQDATGGVAVPDAVSPPLRLGDLVEVEGQDQANTYPALLRNARVRLLWPDIPTPPTFISVDSAVTGLYEGRLVRLEARLERRFLQNGMLHLELATDHQRFIALLNAPISQELLESNLGSVLRITGVCTSDTQYRPARLPFVLLLRSAADVQVVSGPPWWSLRSLLMGAVAVSFVILLAVIFYIRAEQWKLHAVLEERQRLAHELHDTLAQSFAGIGLQLRALRRKMPASLPGLQDDLDVAAEFVRRGHQEARQSISFLRPRGAEQIELVPALVSAARRMIADESVSIQVRIEGEERAVPLQILDILFRAGVEGITNVVRHASASEIVIALTYRPESIALCIEDNGVGVHCVSVKSDGFGITGMVQRVASVHGVVQLLPLSPAGTCLEVKVPLPPTNHLYQVVRSLTHLLLYFVPDKGERPNIATSVGSGPGGSYRTR